MEPATASEPLLGGSSAAAASASIPVRTNEASETPAAMIARLGKAGVGVQLLRRLRRLLCTRRNVGSWPTAAHLVWILVAAVIRAFVGVELSNILGGVVGDLVGREVEAAGWQIINALLLTLVSVVLSTWQGYCQSMLAWHWRVDVTRRAHKCYMEDLHFFRIACVVGSALCRAEINEGGSYSD